MDKRQEILNKLESLIRNGINEIDNAREIVKLKKKWYGIEEDLYDIILRCQE